MPALIAPQPQLAVQSTRATDPFSVASPPPIYYTPDSPHSLRRLKSPIALADSLIRSPHQSCPSPRRRSKPGSHSLRRRRPFPRLDYPVDPAQHLFDQLPWISALDSTPDNVNPWDIADLSQLSDPISSHLPTSALGPVRRRKTSLRSNPMATNDSPVDSPPSFPLCDTSSQFSTPPSRFIPSRILFRDLMPVSCDDGSFQCINITSFHF